MPPKILARLALGLLALVAIAVSANVRVHTRTSVLIGHHPTLLALIGVCLGGAVLVCAAIAVFIFLVKVAAGEFE